MSSILTYVVFLLVSHFILMRVFRLTTYHAFFFKFLPLLIGFGACAAWAMYDLKLHEFFLWHVVITSVWLFFTARKDSKGSSLILKTAGDDADMVRLLSDSMAKTSRYYSYSAFTYLFIFSVVYLLIYNQ